MKRFCCLWLILGLLAGMTGPVRSSARADTSGDWVAYNYRELVVGNPTPMEGKFFTSMWGGTTSDLDVQQLLHGYNLVKWDSELGRIRFDRSVVSGGVAVDDEEGNRTYIITLQKDLRFSDGTLIMAWDYAFGLLLSLNPVIKELNGHPMEASWLMGYDEYINRKSKYISGLRVLGNYVLSVTVKAEALPYFHELARLSLKPYPIGEIAPGHSVADEGRGASITPPLTAEELEQSILDPETGYLSHPKTVSGPYLLTDYDGETATFGRNEAYKGNEEGRKPILETLTFTQADPETMIQDLGDGTLGLLNKVARADLLLEGMELTRRKSKQYTMSNYLRSGLSVIRFNENSPRVQEPAVRKAAAYCLDREAFVREYLGDYGMTVDGYYGIGQWMYRMTSGNGTYTPPESTDDTPEDRQARAEQAKALKALNLEGVTRYSADPDLAGALLEEAGWTLNMSGGAYKPEDGGIRCRIVDSHLLRMRLTMAVPDSPELISAMGNIFVPVMAQAGIELKLQPMDLDSIQSCLSGENEEIDMAFLGINFSEVFDPEVFRPNGEGEIARANAELYEMSQEMVRTDPEDVAGFLTKWVRLQERISETLPLIPIYSNMYFDFYTCELHDYQVLTGTSWADAIPGAYMGYPDT